jgi:hypothetical protein
VVKLDATSGKIIGCLGAIAIGLVDHWLFKDSFGGNYDALLIGAGFGGLGLSIPAGVVALRSK